MHGARPTITRRCSPGLLQRRPEAAFTRARGSRSPQPAGRGSPTAATEFEQAFTAHKTTNAALIPNDENGAPIITYLKSHGVKPNTFPTTGQDATLTGLQNVLSGYQCGTVYKPIYAEAQAAVALALYLRAGKTPPASLLNGTTDRHQREEGRALGAAQARMGDPHEHEEHVLKTTSCPPPSCAPAVLRRRLQEGRDKLDPSGSMK